MNIKYFDIFYRINGDVHQDWKEILMYDSQKHLSKEIPVVDDLRDLEMFEIMRMPVIRLPPKRLIQLYMRLEILCCSYFQGCLFIYLFSGGKWNYYMKFYYPNL